MASDAYRIVDANDTIVSSGTLGTMDGYEAIIQALPSQVTFPVTVVVNSQTRNNAAMLSAAIGDVARPYAGYVDDALSRPEVSGVYSLQDTNDSLVVVAQWVVTVQSSSGSLAKQLTLAFTDLIPDRLDPIVAKAQQDLDALEASGTPEAA